MRVAILTAASLTLWGPGLTPFSGLSFRRTKAPPNTTLSAQKSVAHDLGRREEPRGWGLACTCLSCTQDDPQPHETPPSVALEGSRAPVHHLEVRWEASFFQVSIRPRSLFAPCSRIMASVYAAQQGRRPRRDKYDGTSGMAQGTTHLSAALGPYSIRPGDHDRLVSPCQRHYNHPVECCMSPLQFCFATLRRPPCAAAMPRDSSDACALLR